MTEMLEFGLTVMLRPSCLYDSNLLLESRKNFFVETVELIEATTRAAHNETCEITAYTLHDDGFVAIQNKRLATKFLTQSFGRFCLACACGTVWITAVTEADTFT